MHKFLDAFKARISRPDDIAEVGDVLVALASDNEAIQALLYDYFSALGQAGERGPRQTIDNYMSLVAEPTRQREGYDFALGISLHHPGASPTIASQTAFTTLTPLNQPVDIQLYSLPERWNPEVFDPTIEVEEGEVLTLTPRQTFSVRPGRKTCHFRFRHPTLFLKVQSDPLIPFEWAFDAITKKAWQCISAFQLDTNASHSCIRAQAFADASLAGELSKLLEYPRHFVRWGAAQALGTISEDLGTTALKHLLADPHPHVARAAERSLLKLQRSN